MAGSRLGMKGAQENSAVVVSDFWAGSGQDLGQGLREGGHSGLGSCIQSLDQGPGPGPGGEGCRLLGSCLALAIRLGHLGPLETLTAAMCLCPGDSLPDGVLLGFIAGEAVACFRGGDSCPVDLCVSVGHATSIVQRGWRFHGPTLSS